MVAITVILAKVIASFVLGLGPGEAAPTVDFDFEGGTDQITVTHSSGDKIDAGTLSIMLENPAGDTETFDHSAVAEAYSDGSEISRGSTFTIDSSGSTVDVTASSQEGEWTVSVIYDGGGDQTSTLEEQTVNVS